MTLAYQAFRREQGSVGGGWLARAERLLEAEPESAVHARLAVFHALGALMETGSTDGIELADRAMELAHKHRRPDANFMAMSFKGMALVFTGDLQAGFALIDEAATAASSGQLDLRVASDIYCNTIAACRNAGDLKRARSGPTKASAGCVASRWAATRGSAASIGPSSRCCAATGRRPNRKRARRARSSSATGFSMGSATPTTRSARFGCGWATSTRRPKRSSGPTSSGTPPSPAWRSSISPAVRSKRPRGRSDAPSPRPRVPRTSRPGDPRPPAAGSGRHRARGRRPRDGRSRRRRARIDRRRFPAAGLRGRRPHGAWRAAPRRGSTVGGVADPGPVVAALAGDGSALRERPGATPLRRGDGRRRRRGDRSSGPAGGSQRRSSGSGPGAIWRGSDALLGEGTQSSAVVPAGDQDIHVHRHRHLDRPRRADR